MNSRLTFTLFLFLCKAVHQTQQDSGHKTAGTVACSSAATRSFDSTTVPPNHTVIRSAAHTQCTLTADVTKPSRTNTLAKGMARTRLHEGFDLCHAYWGQQLAGHAAHCRVVVGAHHHCQHLSIGILRIPHLPHSFAVSQGTSASHTCHATLHDHFSCTTDMILPCKIAWSLACHINTSLPTPNKQVSQACSHDVCMYVAHAWAFRIMFFEITTTWKFRLQTSKTLQSISKPHLQLHVSKLRESIACITMLSGAPYTLFQQQH